MKESSEPLERTQKQRDMLLVISREIRSRIKVDILSIREKESKGEIKDKSIVSKIERLCSLVTNICDYIEDTEADRDNDLESLYAELLIGITYSYVVNTSSFFNISNTIAFALNEYVKAAKTVSLQKGAQYVN